ncbi:macro domain-containing protein [Petrotoga sp. 9PW.55.5.1]|uniref:macro domain-containing protein n=1 Tax=Petrotoga sp. 9PW.55.5.1 TaxID=1308979 RepID=UPI000DD6DF15|nr:macro domain-containing protein [Petrotoga sp. 9PW.55.5.1]
MNKIVKEDKIKDIKITLVFGDITIEKVDAIVNAANSHLQHGGGVAGIISRKGGSLIQEESNQYLSKYGSVETGDVAVTSGGYLNCEYIIHTVGPIWHGGSSNEEKLLYKAVFNSLKKAEEMQLTSIALPAISAGIYGYPIEKAVVVYKKAVFDFIESKPSFLKDIRFIIYNENHLGYFEKEFSE